MPVNTISRRKLTKLVQQLSDQKLSGTVVVKTKNQRAIALRFSTGRLVRINARGNSIEDVIDVLHQSMEYTFTFSPMDVDSGPELMQVSELIDRLGQVGIDDTDISLSSVILDGNSDSDDNFNREILHAILVQLVVSEIRPVATMVVDQAIDDGGSIDNIINLIAEHIPDIEAANRFIELALEGTKDALI